MNIAILRTFRIVDHVQHESFRPSNVSNRLHERSMNVFDRFKTIVKQQRSLNAHANSERSETYESERNNSLERIMENFHGWLTVRSCFKIERNTELFISSGDKVKKAKLLR